MTSFSWQREVSKYSRSRCSKKDIKEAKTSKMESCDVWKGSEKMKHKSSKSRRDVSLEEADPLNSKRMRVSYDRYESRKKAGGSNGVGSGDEDDNAVGKDSRSNIPRKNTDEWKGKSHRLHINSGRESTCQTSGGNTNTQGALNSAIQGGPKDGNLARGGRGRLKGWDAQRFGFPPSMMHLSFSSLAMPPGSVQPIVPNMNHTLAPLVGSGVIVSQFPGPFVWPGTRGVDMNLFASSPTLPPVPSYGSTHLRFPPNMKSCPGHSMYFNQAGTVMGTQPNISGPGFSIMEPSGYEPQHDKTPAGWTPQRNSRSYGKAPSRAEQNDYSQNFVDTGIRPQNFIRELELTSVLEDYPKLRELIQRKDEIVAKSASPAMYYKCDLLEHELSPEFFGTKFDVILVDPPWEEYALRAPGITDHLEYWTFEQILDLKIEAIADTPSFIFLWVGDGVGLKQGRQCLKKWGFRRCEDICWLKTNRNNVTLGLRHDSDTLFQHSKEHCLVGIKGTVRRSIDGHIIHANIDTDVITAEEPSDGSTKKPEDMYRIIEHFALGRRRLELFGEDYNIRDGWLTVGKGLSSSNFDSEAYARNFSNKNGKVWQGGGGRIPPPDAPHLVLTTPEIESLRPKSPPPKNQQKSTPVMPTGSYGNRRSRNYRQNPVNPFPFPGMNPAAPVYEPATQAPWSSSKIGFRGPHDELAGADVYNSYGFNASFPQAFGDHIDIEPHRAL